MFTLIRKQELVCSNSREEQHFSGVFDVHHYRSTLGSLITLYIFVHWILKHDNLLQVVSKPEFKFLEDALFRNISILIWDPANYSSTLEEWFYKPDFPLFPVYKRYERREYRCSLINFVCEHWIWFLLPQNITKVSLSRLLNQRKDADVHLLKPEVLWELWAVLQDASPYRLRRNPPSSGFLGNYLAIRQRSF